jgi:pyruvate dehydrogenase E1 component beta subunit
MQLNERVVVMGQLVDYEPGVFGTTTGLVDQFGPHRVRDFPVSESAMTAAAIGAAAAGLRPVLVHHRLDFMLYSMDAVANWLALWRFKSNGAASAPVVIRSIVGRGWGQGPQHSKSLHAWFAHLPGMRVVLPATPFDAKGLLLEAIFGENPAIFVEHRSLFGLHGDVPSVPYRVRMGNAIVRLAGAHITIAAVGVMVPFALRVAKQLGTAGVSAEVIDLRTISPLDTETIVRSVMKTGHLCVMDPAWRSFGASAEIAMRVVEAARTALASEPIRITQPDSHTPAAGSLEQAYYPDELETARQIEQYLNRS